MSSISYKPNASKGRKPTANCESLNMEIKTHPRKNDSETVSIYVPGFKVGSLKSFLCLLIYITNNTNVWSLKAVPHIYTMTKNLLTGEALCMLKHQF